jgi:hypothetical protein
VLDKVAKTSPAADRKDVLAWVERVATFFAEHYGLPPITGRILGWLMICDPPEQSPAEIAAAIGASRASLTTNIRLLIEPISGSTMTCGKRSFVGGSPA